MTYYVIKLLVSALIIVLVSEIGKRNSLLAALLMSLPLVSLLAIGWIYFETKDITKIAQLSQSTLWLVLPSLVFFALLPPLFKSSLSFYVSLSVALGAMFAAYGTMLFILKKAGISL